MATYIWGNIGTGNGLVPDDTKTLPEPMFTYNQQGPLTSFQGNVILNTQDINPEVGFEL